MAHNALVLQKPPQAAAQLILLFHAEGSSTHTLEPLGKRLAEEFPNALVAVVEAPTASANGFAWFSSASATDNVLQERATQAMPDFAARITAWQTNTGVGPDATALIGFAQGAVMALESTKLPTPLASRVVAIAGQFLHLPQTLDYAGTVHLLHGKDDAVIPYQHTVSAAHRLRDLGTDMTAEVIPHLGHDIHEEFIDVLVQKLSTHISQNIWKLAMQAQ
jgi:phospholipase/carboxylesterase